MSLFVEQQLTLESAFSILASYGYHTVIRFEHLHASPSVGEPPDRGYWEDERHICHLNEVPHMTGSQFRNLLRGVFHGESHTRVLPLPHTWSLRQ